MKYPVMTIISKAVLVLALDLFGGCGVPPVNPANVCDDFAFFASFQKGQRESVTEIECKESIINGPKVPRTIALYTVYVNRDGTTVAYWANARPINVTGKAPTCVLDRYKEAYPLPIFKMNDCVATQIFPSPVR